MEWNGMEWNETNGMKQMEWNLIKNRTNNYRRND